NMDSVEGLAATAFDIEADGVHDPVGAGKNRGNRGLIMHISFDRLLTHHHVRPEGNGTRSGQREAARTLNPRSSKCRMTRCPRKPVAPNTVATLPRLGVPCSEFTASSDPPDPAATFRSRRMSVAHAPPEQAARRSARGPASLRTGATGLRAVARTVRNP